MKIYFHKKYRDVVPKLSGGVISIILVSALLLIQFLFGLVYQSFYTSYWSAVLFGLLFVSGYLLNTKTQSTLKSKTTPVNWLVILVGVLIIGAGISLRVNDISQLGFWIDESISVLIGNQILLGYGDTFLSGVDYNRAELYHYLLAAALYLFENEYFASRVLNVIFFIPLILTIYVWASRLAGSYAGLIAMFVFAFSSFGIAMFREARFYEYFALGFTLLALGTFVSIEKLISAQTFKELVTKKNVLLGLALLVLGWLLLQTNALVAYILYPLTAYFFFLFLQTRQLRFVTLSLLSFGSLIIALIINFGREFKFSYILRQPQAEWKIHLPDQTPLDVLHFFSFYEYGSLYPILLLSIPLLIIYWRNRLFSYLQILILVLFVMVGIQGYGVISIRYFYLLLPLVSISLGVTIWYYGNLLWTQGWYCRTAGILVLVFITGTLWIFAYSESSSITTSSSMISMKNIETNTMFAFLENQDMQDSIVITDFLTSIPYYVYFKTKPTYVLSETLLDKNRIYLDPESISFSHLSDLTGAIIYLILAEPSQTFQEADINALGTVEIMYTHDQSRIYKIQVD